MALVGYEDGETWSVEESVVLQSISIEATAESSHDCAVMPNSYDCRTNAAGCPNLDGG